MADDALLLELTSEEVELLRAALRLLLGVEDDPEEIRQVKDLLRRLPAS